jgi:hypothetical protein
VDDPDLINTNPLCSVVEVYTDSLSVFSSFSIFFWLKKILAQYYYKQLPKKKKQIGKEIQKWEVEAEIYSVNHHHPRYSSSHRLSLQLNSVSIPSLPPNSAVWPLNLPPLPLPSPQTTPLLLLLRPLLPPRLIFSLFVTASR